ncbi:MAG: PQQ-binding-like beta-propeller repeat protein [Acidobacteriaceae bacterium]|nr:PQQ-binding-like beta-propeller repeat protein [Acidobacteriaceae bacterium]
MLVYRIKRLTATLALAAVTGSASDWLSERGDADSSGWQRHETAITSATVAGLKVIWKVQLTGSAWSSPVILGRLVSHRGTVELVFVLCSSGDLFAVDGDFGKVFWKRRLEPFGTNPPTPVLAPPAPGYNEEEDDDVPQPLRPLYVVADDGRLHAIHPGLGSDLNVWNFLPRGSHADALNLAGNEVVASVRGIEWRIDVSRTDSKSETRQRAVPARDRKAVWQDAHGLQRECKTTTTGLIASTWRWTAANLTAAPVVGGGLVFALSNGRLTALDAASGRVLFQSDPVPGAARSTSEMALANGHLCFVTSDGVLYGFGFPVDQ